MDFQTVECNTGTGAELEALAVLGLPSPSLQQGARIVSFAADTSLRACGPSQLQPCRLLRTTSALEYPFEEASEPAVRAGRPGLDKCDSRVRLGRCSVEPLSPAATTSSPSIASQLLHRCSQSARSLPQAWGLLEPEPGDPAEGKHRGGGANDAMDRRVRGGRLLRSTAKEAHYVSVLSVLDQDLSGSPSGYAHPPPPGPHVSYASGSLASLPMRPQPRGSIGGDLRFDQNGGAAQPLPLPVPSPSPGLSPSAALGSGYGTSPGSFRLGLGSLCRLTSLDAATLHQLDRVLSGAMEAAAASGPTPGAAHGAPVPVPVSVSLAAATCGTGGTPGTTTASAASASPPFSPAPLGPCPRLSAPGMAPIHRVRPAGHAATATGSSSGVGGTGPSPFVAGYAGSSTSLHSLVCVGSAASLGALQRSDSTLFELAEEQAALAEMRLAQALAAGRCAGGGGSRGGSLAGSFGPGAATSSLAAAAAAGFMEGQWQPLSVSMPCPTRGGVSLATSAGNGALGGGLGGGGGGQLMEVDYVALFGAAAAAEAGAGRAGRGRESGGGWAAPQHTASPRQLRTQQQQSPPTRGPGNGLAGTPLRSDAASGACVLPPSSAPGPAPSAPSAGRMPPQSLPGLGAGAVQAHGGLGAPDMRAFPFSSPEDLYLAQMVLAAARLPSQGPSPYASTGGSAASSPEPGLRGVAQEGSAQEELAPGACAAVRGMAA